jgi:DNA-directed RNA polymerase specialized sigma24 family protein
LRGVTNLEPIDWKACVRMHSHTVVLGLVAGGVRLDEARELAHDAFARLYEQWATRRLTALDFPGIAMRQASWLLADRRRAQGTSMARAAPLDDALGVPAPAVDAEQGLDAQRALALTVSALAACTPRQQAVLAAVLESPGVPHRTLASSAGLSVQRFRQVLCQARARLRSAVGGRP